MSINKNKKDEIREIVYCKDEDKCFADIFVYEPENADEQKLGSLFIVGEIDGLPRNSSYIINILASKIKKGFYMNSKASTEESLEGALMEANKVISDLIKQGNSEYVGKLNMVCGAYGSGKMLLTKIGNIRCLLLRNGKMSNIVDDKQMRSVLPDRAFNNVANGELLEGDTIMFATSGIFDVFSLKQIEKISKNNIDDFANKVQEQIEEKDEDLASMLVIRIGGDSSMKIEPVVNVVEEPISQDLDEIEEDNSNIEKFEGDIDSISEEESDYEDAVEGVKKIEEKNVEVIAEEASNKIEHDAPKEDENIVHSKKKVNLEELKKIEPLENNVVESISTEKKEVKKISLSDIIREYEKIEESSPDSVDKNIESVIFKKDNNGFADLDEKDPNIFAKIFTELKSALNKIDLGKVNSIRKGGSVSGGGKNLSFFKNRNIVLVALILFVIVVGSGMKKQEEEKTAEVKSSKYETLLAESESKMNQAEVELISDSSRNAGELFLEARNIAIQVRDEYDALDVEAEEIITKAQTEIDRIDLVRSVDNSEVLVSGLENNSFKKIVQSGDDLYLFNSNDKSIYAIENSSAVKKFSDNSLDNALFWQDFRSEEVIVSNGSMIGSFDSSSSDFDTLKENIGLGNIDDISTYSSYIYLLSAENNQIYKTQKSGQTLTDFSEWIKVGDIKDTVSLTIDQYIYLLTKNGSVKKYFIGSEYLDVDNEKYSIEEPIENITDANKIVTVPEKKYLYILESSKDRVLVFDKETGVFMKQFKGGDLSGVKDISIDEEEEYITALTADKVIRFEINQ